MLIFNALQTELGLNLTAGDGETHGHPAEAGLYSRIEDLRNYLAEAIDPRRGTAGPERNRDLCFGTAC